MIGDEALLCAYDEQMRGVAHAGRSGATIERDGPLLRVAGQHRGFVTGPRDLGVDGPGLDALIERQRAFFAARGESVEWKTRGHDLPADLTARLRAAGFVPEDRETVLIGVAASMVGGPDLPSGVLLRQVTSDPDMRAIAAMESEVWGQDWGWLADDLIARVASAPDDIAVFAVCDQVTGQVVSAAWLAFYPGTEFAGLWGGSTLTAWRGRGIYRALVAARARHAVQRGTRYLESRRLRRQRPHPAAAGVPRGHDNHALRLDTPRRQLTGHPGSRGKVSYPFPRSRHRADSAMP